MRIGPYEVKARLGRGGMGDVFLARHAGSGELVALKRARDVDAGHLASLRREIYALSRLRHPGIVRLVDHGTDEGTPWCALELVDGETLHTVLEPHLTGPARAPAPTPTTATLGTTFAQTTRVGEPIPFLAGPRAAGPAGPPPPYVVARALATMRLLCEPLGFLHGEGIVHCDLKPTNIVLRPDGTPVIIDFGLMVHFSGPHGRERLDESYVAIGTVEYMAPERIRRELADARADLYAIGCMLYEILTGQTPFTGEPRSVMRQHLSARPEPPSARVPGIAPELDELVLRLLEKDPRARLGYADSVAAALDAAVAGGSPASRRDASAAPRPRAYLYRPTFAGQAAVVRSVTMEPGGMVLIGAESGAGKTRIAMEIARALAGEMRVVTGECLPLGAGGAAVLGAPLHPFLPLLRMIADECRSQGPGMTEMLLGRRGRVLADYEPTLLGLPEVAEQPPPARLAPEAAQQRLHDELAATLFAFSMLQRLVIVLDDLQWADELTLGFLLSLAPESLSDRGVLVLGTYRKDEAGEALFKLAARPGVRRVDLPRLDREAVASIARDMLALREVPEPLVDWLAACSAGNPFFVAEHLRGAVEQGLIARDARGAWGAGPKLGSADLSKLPVPGSVRELLELRLDALSPAAREHIAAAAVVGREIDREVLDRVARSAALLDPEHADAAPVTGRSRLASIEELLARQILEELPDGFRFVHDMLREVAYERVPEARRRALHLAAGRAIEEVFAARGQLPAAYAALAHHYADAAETDKALFYLERAAEAALASSAFEQARAFLTRLLALDLSLGRPAAPIDRARWDRWLGEASYALGDLAGLGEHVEAGLAELGQRLPQTPLEWITACATGLARQAATFVGKRIPLWTSRARPGAEPPEGDAHRSHPAAPRSGPPGAEAGGEAYRAHPTGPPGPPSTAGGAERSPGYDESARHAETAQMAAALAFRYFFAGDAAALIATSLLAVNEAEAASARPAGRGAPVGPRRAEGSRGLSRPYAYLGYLTGLSRLHPVARAYFRSAAEAGRAADDPDGIAYALTTEAVYKMCLCKWSAAEQAAEEALAIQLANANTMEAELLHTILGNVEYFTGRMAASRRRFEALHDTALRRHNELRRAWGLYAMARCDLAEGKLGTALALLGEAEEVMASASEQASELVIDGLFASALLASGDVRGAEARAERIAERIDRAHVPTVFSTVHAYVGLAEVRLHRWERSGDRVSLPALRANAYLAGFALMFPLARPAAQRCAARARHLLGRRRDALRGLVRSAEIARELGMPHEEELARLELARLSAA